MLHGRSVHGEAIKATVEVCRGPLRNPDSEEVGRRHVIHHLSQVRKPEGNLCAVLQRVDQTVNLSPRIS